MVRISRLLMDSRDAVPGAAPAAGDALTVSWNDRQPQALAKISGTMGGRRIQAQRVAL